MEIHLWAGKCWKVERPGTIYKCLVSAEKKLAARGQMLRSCASQACRLSIKLSSNNCEYISKYQRVKSEYKQKGGEYFQQICYLQSIVNCLYNNDDYSVEVSQMLIRDGFFQ